VVQRLVVQRLECQRTGHEFFFVVITLIMSIFPPAFQTVWQSLPNAKVNSYLTSLEGTGLFQGTPKSKFHLFEPQCHEQWCTQNGSWCSCQDYTTGNLDIPLTREHFHRTRTSNMTPPQELLLSKLVRHYLIFELGITNCTFDNLEQFEWMKDEGRFPNMTGAVDSELLVGMMAEQTKCTLNHDLRQQLNANGEPYNPYCDRNIAKIKIVHGSSPPASQNLTPNDIAEICKKNSFFARESSRLSHVLNFGPCAESFRISDVHRSTPKSRFTKIGATRSFVNMTDEQLLYSEQRSQILVTYPLLAMLVQGDQALDKKNKRAVYPIDEPGHIGVGVVEFETKKEFRWDSTRSLEYLSISRDKTVIDSHGTMFDLMFFMPAMLQSEGYSMVEPIKLLPNTSKDTLQGWFGRIDLGSRPSQSLDTPDTFFRTFQLGQPPAMPSQKWDWINNAPPESNIRGTCWLWSTLVTNLMVRFNLWDPKLFSNILVRLMQNDFHFRLILRIYPMFLIKCLLLRNGGNERHIAHAIWPNRIAAIDMRDVCGVWDNDYERLCENRIDKNGPHPCVCSKHRNLLPDAYFGQGPVGQNVSFEPADPPEEEVVHPQEYRLLDIPVMDRYLDYRLNPNRASSRNFSHRTARQSSQFIDEYNLLMRRRPDRSRFFEYESEMIDEDGFFGDDEESDDDQENEGEGGAAAAGGDGAAAAGGGADVDMVFGEDDAAVQPELELQNALRYVQNLTPERYQAILRDLDRYT
jgi:hypothetical protein